MAPLSESEVFERLEKKEPFTNIEVGAINFGRKSFDGPLNLSGAIFTQHVSFFETTFSGPVILRSTQFSEGASFLGSTFCGDADFSYCAFTKTAYFFRCHFERRATFTDMVVKPSENNSLNQLYPGEANFSSAFFSGDADFSLAHFYGVATFWGTVFASRVDFSESKFEQKARFYSKKYDVCIARREFPEFFEVLKHKNIIDYDVETKGLEDYAHFIGINSVDDLKYRLKSRGFRQEQINVVTNFWERYVERYGKIMFSGPDPVSFKNALFEKPNESQFIGVNLDKCLFAGSNIGAVHDFKNVTWDKRSTFLWLPSRRAVYDERNVKSSEDCDLVGGVYHGLRKGYENNARSEEAGDFYYGEMEMKRLAKPWVMKYVSLIAMYKYLSGYGEQYILALFWLAMFIFLLFPALYYLSGTGGDVVKAILRSLEVSTFLKSDTTGTATIFGRFVEGFERIIVPLQAGLFALAIRRRFDRK